MKRSWRQRNLLTLLAGVVAVLVFDGKGGAEEILEPDLSKTRFQTGATVEIDWPGLADPILVWLPRNYEQEPDRKWPIILWYHGTNGKPTIEPVWRHTNSRDWILVGMTYREKGVFQGTEENINAELAVAQAVRRTLSKTLRIHDGRHFVGGFSKGGWVSALFIEKDASLAGGLVMGGGVLDEIEEDTPIRRSVFIGIGEVDGNRAMSQRAVRAFGGPRSRVTLDVWEGLGHAFPGHSESLEQWLKVEQRVAEDESSGGGVSPVTSEAIEWFDKAFAGIRRSGDPARERYYELQRLSQLSFFQHIDDESRAAATKLMQELSTAPGMAEELEAEKIYREILDRESRDRLLGTLVICHQDYKRLADQAPATRFGQAAARAAERAAKLIPGE